MIKLANTKDEIANCFDVMHELRPHLQRKAFVETIQSMQQEGFQLAYLTDDNKQVLAVAGFRISVNLAFGKNLYVDDLVTAEKYRSKGYGKQLLTFLKGKAQQENCQHFHLDSGTHREQAHKFYFQQGMTIKSFHFSESI